MTHILWSLLLIAVVALFFLAIRHVQLHLQFRAARKREAQLTKHVAQRSADSAAAQQAFAELSEGIEALKTEVRRADAIRTKTETRLVLQNAELEQARKDLAFYRKIVDIVDS